MTQRRDLRTLPGDDQGVIIIFWAVMLAAILGIVALSFDFGQKAATQSELQSFADQVALAAAGELDGKSDAITRATDAAANLIIDQQTFASGTRALAGNSNYTLTFYQSLPASDTASIDPGVTTDPALARYAQARSTPRTVPFTFTAAFDAMRGGTTANPTIGAVAVAGFTQYACDITPMMFCLPSPTFRANENIGKMILLRSGGSGAAWGPGDFGFLDPAKIAVDASGPCAGLNGVQLDACLIGATGGLTQCFSQRGVDTEPGQKVGIEDAIFNIRFDIYTSIMNGKRNVADYAPAPNVIKGIVPKAAGASCIGNTGKVSSNTVGLPRDSCFAAGTCGGSGRIGDGNWAAGRTNYVLKNYAGVDPHPSSTTRYKYYLAEIAGAGGGASTTAILAASRAESGRPICSANQSPDPDRRVIVLAGIDCAANAITGATNNVPVNEFFKLFLTEPVGTNGLSPATLDIWAEVVGSAESSGGSSSAGGIFHDVVQLYR